MWSTVPTTANSGVLLLFMSSYVPPIAPNYAADAKTLIAHRLPFIYTKHLNYHPQIHTNPNSTTLRVKFNFVTKSQRCYIILESAGITKLSP